MTIHFENLWENGENLFKSDNLPILAILNELNLKIDFYKVLDTKANISLEDKQKLKSRLLGEILLTLTHLSLKDNINTFESLNSAIQYRELSQTTFKV